MRETNGVPVSKALDAGATGPSAMLKRDEDRLLDHRHFGGSSPG